MRWLMTDSWWISKMESGREDTSEERYDIKFCLNLEKIPQKQRMECFRLLLEHLAWIDHQFLSGIRDSRKAGSLWGMMRGVGGVRKLIHQGWLAKGFGLGLLFWIQEEIPLEEASTLQIGSVAFPLGQCTSRQLYPCHRLFDQDGHQVLDVDSPRDWTQVSRAISVQGLFYQLLVSLEWIYLYTCYRTDTVLNGNSSCIVANFLECDIVVSEFEFQSCNYVHFRTNNLAKIWILLSPQSHWPSV